MRLAIPLMMIGLVLSAAPAPAAAQAVGYCDIKQVLLLHNQGYSKDEVAALCASPPHCCCVSKASNRRELRFSWMAVPQCEALSKEYSIQGQRWGGCQNRGHCGR